MATAYRFPRGRVYIQLTIPSTESEDRPVCGSILFGISMMAHGICVIVKWYRWRISGIVEHNISARIE